MEENSKTHAIVFPYPYQGHVTPMINLSLKLAHTAGFTITFVHTEYIHHSISKSTNTSTDDDDDHFDIFSEARKSGLDIRYTTISDGFPMEFDRDLNFDVFWETMFRDFPDRVGDIVERTIKGDEESSNYNYLLIADTVYSWPATIAKKYNMLNVSLWTEPAIVFSINYHLDLLHHNGHFPYKGNCDSDITYIPGVESISTKDLMSYIQDPDIIPMLTQVLIKGFEQVKAADFILCNTVQELGPETMSILNQKQPIYAIGPINFYSDFTKISIAKSLWSESDCTHWLNSKPCGSVLYISFGSVAQSNKHEIRELGHSYGLLLSGVYFIWVLRHDIVGPNESDILPVGFEDLTKDRGLIVPWCNQKMVLSNSATGGFLTHCGWNSVLESMWHGVPMICYPFLVDQPTNRKLVVDDWKIGINLCDGGQLTREEVVKKIKIFTMGEKSIQMKQEIKKVSHNLHDSLDEHGSSHRNFDQFVDDLKAKLYLRRKDGKKIIP